MGMRAAVKKSKKRWENDSAYKAEQNQHSYCLPFSASTPKRYGMRSIRIIGLIHVSKHSPTKDLEA